ncbi:hypothetical protein FRC09_008487 [Ceratobasidium sp. 395]|nr:hypothetical protein FRC09_008487 [Ceratobasidium sp. 395]
MSTALYFLRHLSAIAPGIQRLLLPIQSVSDDDPLDEFAEVVRFWEPPLYDYLGTFTALRELTCTEMFLIPETFSAIARLNNLNVLNIWVDSADPRITLDPDQKCTPASAFPALEQLSIRNADVADTLTVLECSMFQKVSSLRLGIECQPEDEEVASGDPWEYHLIELIARACPRLTDLRIDFDECHQYDEARNLLWPSRSESDALMAMSKLPLETVYISSANLVSTDLNFPIDPIYNADYLMIAWPQVTRIHLPRLLGQFPCLYEFSRLPNLQELTLRLMLNYFSFNEDDFNFQDDLDKLPTGSSPLRILGASSMTWDIEVESDLTARTLLHFWPSLEQIAFLLDPDTVEDEYHRRVIADIDETNRAIKKLRASQITSVETSGKAKGTALDPELVEAPAKGNLSDYTQGDSRR